MSCNRTWQAEPSVDGRLEPDECASFERHAQTCSDCAAEVASLHTLAEQMSALPEPERSELERRRQRADLQHRAHETLLRASLPQRRMRFAFAGVLVICLAMIAALALRRPIARTPAFEVVDLAQAEWSMETKEATSRVKLRGGTASFHVEHLQGAARFLVELPDGRIEVRGTRFVVHVVQGKTRSVIVTEGTVLLQVPGFDGLLQAGDRWPAIATPPVPTASTEPSPSPTTSAAVVASAVPTVSVAAKPSAGPRFAEAMTAFGAGDWARADALFAAFVREFPRDARVEDAMFLRAQSRSRLGDKAGAALLARQYLDAFPNGLRRPEAKRLAGEP